MKKLVYAMALALLLFATACGTTKGQQKNDTSEEPKAEVEDTEIQEEEQPDWTVE